jgi:acetyl-CoA carboxylase biotin carboxyl carrier protein
MNLDLLESLVKLMSANDLNTVELSDGDQRVVLKRGATNVVQTINSPAPAMHHAPAPAAAPAAPAAPATPAADADAGLVPIKSPMVGTFYAKPTPDAKNFVNVGSVVNEETDVCIIEAMKVFNNIKAETRGTIVRVVAEDGKSVEFGQVLFLVKPA